MLIEIDSLLVTPKIISIKVSSVIYKSEYSEALKPLRNINHLYHIQYTPEYQKYKGEGKSLYIEGQIKSINIRKKLTFVIHFEGNNRIISPLSYIVGNKASLSFNINKDATIEDLLGKEAERTKTSKENLLYELTSYSKNGKDYEGRRNITELSERQKNFTIKKLNRQI